MTITARGWLTFFATALTIPLITNAATPVALSLPQDMRYDNYISSSIIKASFSSDPKRLLEIRQTAGLDLGDKLNGEAQLTAHIYNNDDCSKIGETQNYRILIRNIGNESAKSVSIHNQYPEFTSLISHTPSSGKHDGENRLIIWSIRELSPGSYESFEFKTTTDQRSSGYIDNLSVYYMDSQTPEKVKITLGENVISGNCGPTDSIRSFIAGRALPAQPAILCDVAQIGPSPAPGVVVEEDDCLNTYDILNLGPNYKNALKPEMQPQVCSAFGQQLREGLFDPYKKDQYGSPLPLPKCKDNKPQLGPRFAEAIADIKPGECRTVEDNRIELPEFNAALNRRSTASSFILGPIQGIEAQQSGNDYKYMIQDNLLLGVDHLNTVRDVLLPEHLEGMNKVAGVIKDLIKGNFQQPPPPAPPISIADLAKAKLAGIKTEVLNKVTNEMPTILANYQTMQVTRHDNFDNYVCGGAPVSSSSCKLLSNIKTATKSVCDQYNPDCDADNPLLAECPYTGKAEPKEGWDGWFRPKLENIETDYYQLLTDREATYPSVQSDSIASYTQLLDDIEAEFGPIADLMLIDPPAAKEQLREFLRKIETERVQYFSDELMTEFREHLLVDQELDDDIRTGIYEDKISEARENPVHCHKESLQQPGEGGLGYRYNVYEWDKGNSDWKVIFPGSAAEVTYCETGAAYNSWGNAQSGKYTTGAEKVDHDANPLNIFPYAYLGGLFKNRDEYTQGAACTGKPGSPWWASDCSCDCGSIVPVNDFTRLSFCRPGQGYWTQNPFIPDRPAQINIPRLWPTPAGVPHLQLPPNSFYRPPRFDPSGDPLQDLPTSTPTPHEPYYFEIGATQEWNYILNKITKGYDTNLIEHKNASNKKQNEKKQNVINKILEISLKKLKALSIKPALAQGSDCSDGWEDGCCWDPGSSSWDHVTGACYTLCEDDIEDECEEVDPPSDAPSDGPPSSDAPTGDPETSNNPSINPTNPINPSANPSIAPTNPIDPTANVSAPPDTPSVPPTSPPSPTTNVSVPPAPTGDPDTPSEAPTGDPDTSDSPSTAPTNPIDPTANPSIVPTNPVDPTNNVSVPPDTSEAPTDKPTDAPTDEPTEAPTDKPTDAPTDKPTDAPTDKPTSTPDTPTDGPTNPPSPTMVPTVKPTNPPSPTGPPKTATPNATTTPDTPTDVPTSTPGSSASPDTPTDGPTNPPSPTMVPTVKPTNPPSPTGPPNIATPSATPSTSPSSSPSPSPSASWCPSPKAKPSKRPASPPPSPSPSPSTSSPSPSPSSSPSPSPSSSPSPSPSPSDESDEVGSKPRNRITAHDVWVTSKKECLRKQQACHHLDDSCHREKIKRSPASSPSMSPSPSISSMESSEPSKAPSNKPSKKPSKMPSKKPSKPPPPPSKGPTTLPSPSMCVNPDGTVVFYW